MEQNRMPSRTKYRCSMFLKNEWTEVKRLYGKSKKACVVQIVAEVVEDGIFDVAFMYSEEADREHARKLIESGKGGFYGVTATAKIILPYASYLLFAGEINSGGLWGIEWEYGNKSSEKYLKEELNNQVDELKDIAKRLNIRIDKAVIVYKGI